jgi:hypothetical protein
MHLSHAFFAQATRFLPKAEYPSFMATMRFSEEVTVPYDVTTRSYTRPVADGDYWYYKTTYYDPPLVERKEYSATKYSWYEAQKIQTADGPRYEIHDCTKQVPGWKCDADRSDDRISCGGGRALYTKEAAIGLLKDLEQVFLRMKDVSADANRTRKHFGRYTAPKPAAPK